MAVLTRDDGTVFAIYTYRELIVLKKASLLKNELMLVARDNGEYARFFDKSHGDFEAIFGHEPGYLLGENIWHHFNQPNDLIYCEQLDDGENAILIVVRDGNVFIDAYLSIANLLDEFLGLIAGENRYDIYIYGELIPLAQTAQEDKFAFDPNLVNTFNILDTPVFPTLAVDENFKLISVQKAIAELGLSETPVLKWIIVLVVLGGIGFGIYKTLQQPAALPEAAVTQAPPPPADPYADYRSALSTPNPATVLYAVVNSVNQLLTVPGWSANKLTIGSDLQQAQVDLTSDGGTTSVLLGWAQKHQLNVDITGDQPQMTINYHLTSRPSPQQIYRLQDTAAVLYDGLQRILVNGTVSLGPSTSAGSYSTINVSLTLNSAASSELVLLAQLLETSPLQMNSLALTIDHGVISGNIVLTLYGVN